ncbi:MAG TPA: hypothetical protein PK640_02615 [Verrucomicrobiota bacterium]|nr:hypothetical protein [Verrucomicrobiota bacterium]
MPLFLVYGELMDAADPLMRSASAPGDFVAGAAGRWPAHHRDQRPVVDAVSGQVIAVE